MPSPNSRVRVGTSYITASLVLAACYTHMGRLADARGTIARLRATSSDKRMRMNMFRDASYQEFYLAGLTPALAACEEDGLSSVKCTAPIDRTPATSIAGANELIE